MTSPGPAQSEENAAHPQPETADEPLKRIVLKGLVIGVVCGGLALVGSQGADYLRRMVAPVGPRPAAPQQSGPDADVLRLGPGPAGGMDTDVPPPPDSERLFAPAPASRRGVRMSRYRTGIAIPELVSYYRGRMAERGWRELEKLSEGYSSGYADPILVFSRPGRTCVIALRPGRMGSGAMVDVLSYAGEPNQIPEVE